MRDYVADSGGEQWHRRGQGHPLHATMGELVPKDNSFLPYRRLENWLYLTLFIVLFNGSTVGVSTVMLEPVEGTDDPCPLGMYTEALITVRFVSLSSTASESFRHSIHFLAMMLFHAA